MRTKAESKKIFHFLNTGSYSGAENVVINITQLVDNYEHVYVSPDGQITEILKKNNIKHIPIPKLSFLTFSRIIRKYRPDIVQAHDFKASIIAGSLSSKVTRYGGKVISQIHKNDMRMSKISLLSVVFLLLLKSFSKVIVVSQAVVDEYIFKDKLKDRAVVINNIVNLENIQKESLAFDVDYHDIVYVARISDEKDPLRFVNIIEQVNLRKPIKVIWVGEGNMVDIVKKAISVKNLDNVIELVGFQSNPYPYIKAGKVALLTSKYEGFGLSVLESQLLEKPVVSTNVGGLHAIVSDKSGLLTNDDSEFVNEVVKLLEDEQYYLEKQKHAKIQSMKINDISGYVKKFKSIYEES
ncbi:glycosyltransferase [Leuconostoc lactis]|uniref:glycosyltransferase n=1 Tax=Leuconostoc lactis TaxID=1246 RepID=UPI0011BB34D4|nr:glycosyltransferase [Leuconostoc lactis]QEA50367.1 glycosyltransferase [Leuconostoc lactis]